MNNNIDRKIDAKDKTLREILESKKYDIDYFQREYKWEEKHLKQLLTDLEEAFIANVQDGDRLEDISRYSSYFMGPIIFLEQSNSKSIVDGQQRLTSITLLLIYLNNLQKDRDDKEEFSNLIYSTKYGRKSFNLDIDERQEILDCLFKQEVFNVENVTDLSVRNIYDRYEDIKEAFPDKLKEDLLPLFINWLQEKLVFVDITAHSSDSAFTIFETMNDRGFNLTPSEMLKSYLLSSVRDQMQQERLNRVWRDCISKLHLYGVDEDLEFFRAWLRAKYADTMKTSQSSNEDFERIGTSFHRWVKDKKYLIGLDTPDTYASFIGNSMPFYIDIYELIKSAERGWNGLLQLMQYQQSYSIANSLTYPLFLASVEPKDTSYDYIEKLRIVSEFIDCFAIKRSMSNLPITQTTIRYQLYPLVKEIRNLSVEQLDRKLGDFLQQMDGVVDLENSWFISNKLSRYLIARITLYLDRLCGIESDFYNYINGRRARGGTLNHFLDNEQWEYAERGLQLSDTYLRNIPYYGMLQYGLNMRSIEANIWIRANMGNLRDEEKEILGKRFTLPHTLDLSREWFEERMSFFGEVYREIWVPITFLRSK